MTGFLLACVIGGIVCITFIIGIRFGTKCSMSNTVREDLSKTIEKDPMLIRGYHSEFKQAAIDAGCDEQTSNLIAHIAMYRMFRIMPTSLFQGNDELKHQLEYERKNTMNIKQLTMYSSNHLSEHNK